MQERMIKPSLLELFFRFFRLGLTAFGGPAMIPYIRRLAVERHEWLDEGTFRLGMSVTQLIPGATAMQMAAYVGLRARGGAGALAAYSGFALPAFLLMLGLTVLYFSARDIVWIRSGFAGLQLVVIALIGNAAFNFSRKYLDSARAWLLAVLAGVWLGFKGDPVLALVVVCTLAVFLFRRDQGGPPPSNVSGARANLRWAVIFLAGLLGLLAILAAIDPKLLGLSALMMKIDSFAFGGGYVSVPLMLHEVVEARAWMSQSTFMDGIALGQLTPGPIVITGTFVGYAVAGFPGAILATISVFGPSLVFLCAVTPFADRLAASPVARRVLHGSLITLVGLMAAVTVRFAMDVHWGVLEVLFTLAALAALRKGVDILWVVLACAALSPLLF